HSQHQSSNDALARLRAEHQLVIVPQVLYEFWAVVTRPVVNNGLGMTVAEASVVVSDLKLLFPVLRDERAIFAHWEQLVTSLNIKGKQSHDARLAAAMQRHTITHLLTFNSADFTRFPFITTISPIDVA